MLDRFRDEIHPRLSLVLEWMANGDTCPASLTLVFWVVFGIRKEGAAHPRTVPDFKRCLAALELIGSDDLLYRASDLSPEWGALVAAWADLYGSICEESSGAWRDIECAPATHRLLRSVCIQKPFPVEA